MVRILTAKKHIDACKNLNPEVTKDPIILKVIYKGKEPGSIRHQQSQWLRFQNL